ncbi:MAG: Asp-tRNA(Asn)/Glu-tRNA(Gln) amidotransferase subunit GatB [Bdellovibrio sp.]|nr:MAG: Asp-tRNA(Asn)/Glu-tRNA(Gln) amidotransferase subunit GatB [Bdellovibrio sp.]
MSKYGDWEPVIGLEIHAQLLTKSKMFSSDSTSFGGGDNENVSPVTLGLPGALPVVNKKAVELSVKVGLALNCKIRHFSVFARKNYFYPDLPKGYQISQYDEPLAEEGFVEIYVDGQIKKIGITRAHMEEDAGKSTHHGDFTLINLNRAGVPLLEIVSEPDIASPAEAAEYARTIRRILRYLEVCDGNLEEGSMRCDCNVSVRKKGTQQFGTKVELKNLNSFRFVEKALEYEIERQIMVIESGEKVIQETRLYDSAKNRTHSMRSKEEAHDYRYFPDPDLLPVQISENWIQEIKSSLPELPIYRARRFQEEFKIPEYDAFVLTQEKDIADYFEEVAEQSGNPKAASNWVMVELLREIKESKKEISNVKIQPKQLAQLIKMIDSKQISGKIAKTVFAEMWERGQDPQFIVKEKGLVQISDPSSIEKMVEEVLSSSPQQVKQYREGKKKVFGYFVGQVMKATKGQANPELVNKILKEKLGD